MIGLTWLRISDRILKRKKEFDRQVIRAALIGDIRGRSGAGPNLLMMNGQALMASGSHDTDRAVFEELPSDIKKPPDPWEGRTEKCEGRAHGQRKGD